MLAIATIDPILRKDLTTNLYQKGDPFLVFQEGDNIVSMVLHHNPSLIILDLYLSQPSGLEILRQLRSAGFSGKVILLGGPSSQTLTPEASRLGAVQIVGRPFSSEQILGALRIAGTSQKKD